MGYTLSEAFLYASGVVLLLVLLRAARQFLQSPAAHVPGPWYSKWTSLVLDFHFLNGSRTYYVHALHQQYGPVVRIAPDEVDVTDIEAIKTIYSTKETFRKSQFYRRVTLPGQQSLFTTVEVDFHRRHRRLLAGPMAESSLKSVVPHIEARVRLAIDKMGEESRGRRAWRELPRAHARHLQKNNYARELERVGRMSAIRITFPSLMRLTTIIPLPVFKLALDANANMRRYASDSLERYRRLVDADPGLVKQTLFTKLFQAEQEEKMAFNEILDKAQTYIIAGSDTTANSLTYLTWSVCRRSGIRATLVEELRTLPADFTEAQLRDLPFLNHVVDETLRLYSAAPSSLLRIVPPGGAELAGYRFDEGTVVGAQAFSMHRDPAVFPDPDEFDPSRWASPTKTMKDAYMPFGRGPRICIGLHLAKMELRVAAARFFLAFPDARVSSHEGMCDGDMRPTIHFLLTPSGGRCLIQAA